MAEAFFLSDDDRIRLRQILDTVDKDRGNDDVTDPREADAPRPSVHLIRVPCGETIPARVGSDPGYAECCLYRLTYKTTPHGDDYTISAMTLSAGTPIRKIIHNPYEDPVPDDRWWRVERMRDGRWIVEKPETTTTTTTAVPTTTTPNFGNQPADGNPQDDTTATQPGYISGCVGSCQWAWDNPNSVWVIAIDNCGAAPTTTTAAPVTTTTTTTTTSCLCDPTTTTTTTTAAPAATTTIAPTTTTAEPCTCLYPIYCGTFTGETTVTYCGQGTVAGSSGCATSTTTTTTCDCSTSTTQDLSGGSTPNCAGNTCLWYLDVGMDWMLIQNSCPAWCPCAYPGSPAGLLPCYYYVTPCYDPPPSVPTPPPSCSGECTWGWDPVRDDWFIMAGGCSQYGDWAGGNCDCAPPSTNGGPDCRTDIIPCQNTNAGGTTTTAQPCTNCLPQGSTTTTTTTVPNCLNCKWRWVDYSWQADHWEVMDDDCAPDCACVEPAQNGIAAGETRMAGCGTTTTTTTTTTANPCSGEALWSWCDHTNAYYLVSDYECRNLNTLNCGAESPYAGFPTQDGDVHGIGGNCDNTVTVPCKLGGVRCSGSLPAPCSDCPDFCTSTTTAAPTTTTSYDPCENFITDGCAAPKDDCGCCEYVERTGWEVLSNDCSLSCDCPATPEHIVIFSGSTRMGYSCCITAAAPTTTTAEAGAPTTTTADPCTSATDAPCLCGCCEFNWDGLLPGAYLTGANYCTEACNCPGPPSVFEGNQIHKCCV